MSTVQKLRDFVDQRLTAAAEEIFGLFVRTIAEYEEELCRSKTENDRQRKLLDAVFKPVIRLQRADAQLLSKEAVPPKQEWSSSLDREDRPQLPHIKEEEEELWSSQEGEEQPRGVVEEEARVTKLTITSVPVKTEEDGVKQQTSQCHQNKSKRNIDADNLKSETDGKNCGGSEPVRNLNPVSHAQPAAHHEASHSFEPEADDRCDLEETRDPQSGSNPLQISGACPVNSSVCATSFDRKGHLLKHNEVQTDEKPFSNLVRGRGHAPRDFVKTHTRRNSEDKRFSCLFCKKMFQLKGDVVRHIRIHTGEKPFSCSFCGKNFARNSTLTSHLRVHTGEKPYKCSVCKASFTISSGLSKHMRVHTKEKLFLTLW